MLICIRNTKVKAFEINITRQLLSRSAQTEDDKTRQFYKFQCCKPQSSDRLSHVTPLDNRLIKTPPPRQLKDFASNLIILHRDRYRCNIELMLECLALEVVGNEDKEERS